LSIFPSGLSGEQMHQLYGLLYQKTMYGIFRRANRRTLLDVRASNDFASSYPAALYSDTYDHNEYIRMIVTAGFSGMLWSPEVRESRSITDLLRRSETAVLSAQTLFNSWYLQHPPWLQINIDKNNRSELMDSATIVEAAVRQLLRFRMSLVPYLYTAYADYHFKGIPPFRALVMDYPADTAAFQLSDEYMIGSGILAAPLTADQSERSVYLPKGTWYDFNSNERMEGGKRYTIRPAATRLPLFIKAGTILPLADPLDYIPENFRFTITCLVYGDGDTRAQLFEDDGYTFGYEHGYYNSVTLSWKNGRGAVERSGPYRDPRYTVAGWRLIR
jgi:alpha-D-xyloside xylohydrolase